MKYDQAKQMIDELLKLECGDNTAFKLSYFTSFIAGYLTIEAMTSKNIATEIQDRIESCTQH